MKQSADLPYREISATLARKDQIIIQTIAKVDSAALGIAVGILCGAGIFLVTNLLILKGGEHVGQNFALLGHYFIGYSVTFAGSFIGLIYGLATGFIIGWTTASLRNLIIKIYLHILKFKTRVAVASEFLDD